MPVAGGATTDVLTGLSEGVRGIDLDQAAGIMYWTDHVADTISRANLDGTGVEVVLSGLDNPHDVAVDSAAGRIYWTEGIRGSAGSTGAVRSANLDGTDPQDVLTGLSSFIRDLTFASLSAPDDEVRVDFATAGTDPGGNWNTTDGISPIDLVDHATGLATGIQVSVVNAVSQYSGDNEWTAGDKDWMVAAAGRDELFLVGGGQATVVFSDLLGLSYQVEMVSSSSVASDIADITIDGAFADRTFEGRTGSLGDDWNAMTDGRDPGDWLIWDSVTPTNGEITVLFDLTQTGGGAVINAARLTTSSRIFADGFESGDTGAWSSSTP